MTRLAFTRGGVLTLLGATALLPFANGRWSVALAAWVAPALLVRYLRTQPLGLALGGGVLAMSIAEFFWWKGVFPLSGVAWAGAAIVFGCVNLLPYLLDRAIAPHVGGFPGTFVLPSAMVVLETFMALVSPFGSFGSFAYSQSGDLPLLQLLSITGLAGVTFLILWCASVVNWAWESDFAWKRIHRGVLTFAAILIGVHLYGGDRLTTAASSIGARVVAITPRIPTYAVKGNEANREIHAALASARARQRPSPAVTEAFRRRAAAIDRELLQTSERWARVGANIIVWSEGAGIIERVDEPVFLAAAAELAKQHRTWLAVSFLTLDLHGGSGFENKSVLFNDLGRPLWAYRKARPVPGMEDALRPGDGRVPVAQTPWGRVATVICFDLDFPGLVRQAGRAGAGLLLVPADDWPEIAALHERMAKYRAIEQGLSIVRPASNGFSAVFDPRGRTLAIRDYSKMQFAFGTDVPVGGERTIYSRAPEVVPISAAIALPSLAAVALVRRRRARDLELPDGP